MWHLRFPQIHREGTVQCKGALGKNVFNLHVQMRYGDSIIFRSMHDSHKSIESYIFLLPLPTMLLFEYIVPLENFHSLVDLTIAVKGLQILTNAQHIWHVSSEGSSATLTVTLGIR